MKANKIRVPRLSTSAQAHLLLLAVVATWGATFVLVKDALQDISPLFFNLLRMTLAFFVLVLINRRHLRNISRKVFLQTSIVGLLLAAGYQLQTAGLARTTASKSAFITGLVVIFVPLMTLIPVLRPSGTQRPGIMIVVGATLAFLGLALLTIPGGTPWQKILGSVGLGDWLTLGCAIAFAGHLLALARTSTSIPTGQLATLQIGAAAVIMLITLPLDHSPHLVWSLRLLVALLITSVLATAAAFTIQSWVQQHLPPTHTAVMLTLEPVFAAVTSILFLHDHLGRRVSAGACLILCGIVVIEFFSLPAPVPTFSG